MKNKIIILALAIVLFNCANTVELTGFNAENWKNDANGCNGDRLKTIDALIANKEKLRGLNQTDIVALIGKPDRNELYKRSQKFFEYQITPDKSCNSESKTDNTSYLSIRFNATGLAKEILVYRE